jgi:hypothetical protein
MKIFSLRNLVAVAAIGGIYALVRKQGGVKATLDMLQSKTKSVIDTIPGSIDGLRERARDVSQPTV